VTVVQIPPVKYLSTTERISKLGALGEAIAAEWLTTLGVLCTPTPRNYPYADLIGSWNGKKYFVGVKTRNERQMGGRKDNDQYNLVLISDAKRRALEQEGKTREDITRILWGEVRRLAATHDAFPAWVTVSVLPKLGTYSAYFGVIPENFMTRSVRMSLDARRGYPIRVEHVRDVRITLDLLNAPRK